MTDDDIRSRADERRRLMAELELERNQLIRNIETCRIRDIDRPFIGEWSLKDIVAHVVAWEAEYTSALGDIRAGARPRTREITPDREDSWNAEQIGLRRDRQFWDLLGDLHDGRSALLAALREFSDNEITDDTSEAGLVVQDVLSHDRRHWREIAVKLAGMAGVRSTSPATDNPTSSTPS